MSNSIDTADRLNALRRKVAMLARVDADGDPDAEEGIQIVLYEVCAELKAIGALVHPDK